MFFVIRSTDSAWDVAVYEQANLERAAVSEFGDLLGQQAQQSVKVLKGGEPKQQNEVVGSS